MSIVFEFTYKPYMPKGVITPDINLRTITAYDGSKTRRYKSRRLGSEAEQTIMEKLLLRYEASNIKA
jgi:hypothetical protein